MAMYDVIYTKLIIVIVFEIVFFYVKIRKTKTHIKQLKVGLRKCCPYSAKTHLARDFI